MDPLKSQYSLLSDAPSQASSAVAEEGQDQSALLPKRDRARRASPSFGVLAILAIGTFFLGVGAVFIVTGGPEGGITNQPDCEDLPSWNDGAACRTK